MVSIENGPVRPHVQAFADEANRRFGTVFKTYNGHQPTRDRALDCWDTNSDLDALAEFAKQNYKQFGIDYVIWKQRIWNPEISPHWRAMSNRGSVTANHFDHVHISFETTGSATPGGGPPSEALDMTFSRTNPQTQHLAFVHNGLLLGSAHAGGKGLPLEAYWADGQKDQRFVRWGHADGTMSLVTPEINGQRYAVDIPGNRREASTVLHLWEINWTPAQRFKEIMVGHNQFKYSVPDTDLVIDAFWDKQDPGEVGLFTDHNGLNQRFTLHRTL